MIWTPHVTVAAITERAGRFLLVDELVDGLRVLNQPAGHLDKGESLLDAVVRETLEETAWRFTPRAIVGIYRWHHTRKDITFLRVTFSGDVADHNPDFKLDHGIEGNVWMTRSELAAIQPRLRSPMVLRSIDDYLAGARHAISLLSDIP